MRWLIGQAWRLVRGHVRTWAAGRGLHVPAAELPGFLADTRCTPGDWRVLEGRLVARALERIDEVID